VIGLVVIVLLAAPPGGAVELVASSSCSPAELDAIVRGERELPALAEVQAAARSRWRTTAPEASATRARWRGLVPRLDVSVGTDVDSDVRDTLEARTTMEGRALGVRVSARFELGELVYAEPELRMHRERAAAEAALRELLTEVTTIYFERVAVLLLQRSSSTPTVELRARLLDGRLAALTTSGHVP
jgi:hypothetical protein